MLVCRFLRFRESSERQPVHGILCPEKLLGRRTPQRHVIDMVKVRARAQLAITLDVYHARDQLNHAQAGRSNYTSQTNWTLGSNVFRYGKSENLYQNVRLKPIGAHATSPAASPGSQSAGGKSSAQRDSLWTRTSLLFISLWIITLISLITTLGLYFKQSSALQSELTEQQRNSSIHIT
ncbi:hypothetical protein JZ751_011513, partial [Albula glossodonta]